MLKYILLFYVSKMDLVIQAKQRRLQKMHRTKELHGWIVHDPWIQNKVYKNRPLHDWSSHGSDAFRYLALGTRDINKNRQNLPSFADSNYNVLGG